MKRRSRLALRLVAKIVWGAAFALAALSTTACSSGNETTTAPSTEGPPAGSSDSIDEATLARCPEASTLIQTTDWPSCLAGKRVSGTEPFSKQPCELRIRENGVFEYLRSGAVALTVPAKSAWRDATGTYQNTASSGPRLFLASVAPDLAAVDGQPRVTDITLNFFALASQQDNVEIKYLDAALNRQTYNCTVDLL